MIRLAVPDDAFPLSELAIRSFRSAYADHNTPEDIELYIDTYFLPEVVRKELSDERYLYLLAEQEGKLAGYVKMDLHTTLAVRNTPSVEIARLYTDPVRIGQRIGASLMNAAQNLVAQRGIPYLCLGVWTKNFRAVNFYEREGFRITGLTTFVLGRDPQDDFIMEKSILSPESIHTFHKTNPTAL